MSEPYLAEIKIVAYGFTPRGWAQCNGQLLSIAQNTALFSLLGTTFGGNGQTTFGLPDLRGRTPVHPGNNGQITVNLGQVSGEPAHTLTIAEMPTHNHFVAATSAPSTTVVPNNNFLATAQNPLYAPSSLPTATTLIPSTIGLMGGSQPHNNLQPYLVLNFVIALQGIYPSRN